ncbi:MAG: hypothetical protein PWR01_3505 [Clostridiales bacterium]|nr:hypothetical protein [Clostridiales bacterium]MDN5282432.1 hypothetical protein [Candidatus Ozemobacter sp.]
MVKSDRENSKNLTEAGKSFLSFKFRVLLYILPPVLIISGLVIFFLAGMARKMIVTQEENRIKWVLSKLSEDLRDKIHNRDFSAVISAMKSCFEKDQVRAITIKDPMDEVVVTYANTLKKPRDNEICSHTHYLVIRGPQNDTEQWKIELAINQSEIRKMIEQFLLFQAILIGVMTLGVVTGVFMVMDNLVLGPIHSIGKAMDKISVGLLPEALSYDYNDEIGEAISQTNKMIEQARHNRAWLETCLEKSWALHFNFDVSDQIFKFQGDTIPGTPIDTGEFETPEEMCKLHKSDQKVACRQFFFDLNEQISNSEQGSLSHEFEINYAGNPQAKEIAGSESQWIRLDFCWRKTADKVFCGGILFNVSRQKQAAIALKQSEDTFRKLYENCPIGIWRSKGERYIFINQAMARILGYNSAAEAIEQIKSISHQIYLRPEDRTFFFDEMKKKGKAENLEVRLRKSDGSIFWGAIFGRVFHNEDGLYAEGGLIDITARKNAEEAIRNNEETYKLCLESAGTATFKLNFIENSIELKGSVESIFGIKAANISHIKDLLKFIHPDDLQLFPATYANARKANGHDQNNIFSTEFRICVTNRKGELETRWLKLLFKFSSFSTHNKPALQHGIILDITTEKQLQLKLEELKEKAESASKMKSEFFADISHEIRTPLNAIIGFSELLLPALKDSSNESYMNSIVTASRNLLNLINDILDLSKLESGKLEICPEPLSIEVLSRETQAIFNTEAQKKGLIFTTEVDDSVPSILLLDGLRIRQIINNLVWNAIKFTDSGQISVCFAASPAEETGKTDLIIAVEDTGIGISHTDKDYIFEPFSQKRRENKKMSGTGLGLAISKKLAQMMNGEIYLKSEPEKGSRFELRLRNIKIERLTDHLKQDSGNRASLFQFDNQTVLVVDDATSNRELLTEALKAVGLVVFSAKDGNEAVEIAEKYDPELIVMDIRMPEKDGIQATKEIKARKNIPVIALTASVNTSDSEHSEIFDGYLHKPVKLYDLFAESGRFLKFTLRSQEPSPQKDEEQVPAIAFEQIVEPREMLSKIDSNLMKELGEFEGALSIDEISNFARMLKKVGTDHSFNLLALEAEELLQGATNFDTRTINGSLKKIKLTLRRFQDFWTN